MPKVIIIANNLSKIPDIRKVKVNPDDIIIRFNIGVVPKDDKGTDNLNNLWVFFRKQHGGAIGISSNGKIRSKRLHNAAKYILIGNRKRTKTAAKIEKKNNIKMTYLSSTPTRDKYNLDSTPSSGMVAVDYLRKKFPNHQLCLLGFSWKGWRGHAFDIEKKIMRHMIKKGKLIEL